MPFSKLLNLPVKNEKMEKIGEVADLLVKKEGGRIVGVLIKPNKLSELLNKLPIDENGCVAVPFSTVKISGDFIFLNERKLKALLIRAQRYTT